MRTRFPFCSLVFLSFLAATPVLAAVKGTLMDRDGKPAVGLNVAAFELETLDTKWERMQGGKERKAVSTTTSDTNGRFTLDVRKDSVVEIIPQSSLLAPAQILATADDDLGAVRLESATMKQGVVRGSGKAVEGVVVVWSSFQGSTYVTKTDSEGRYSVPDPDLWASGVTLIHPQFAVTQIDRANKRQSFDLTLDAGVTVSGRVLAEDGKSPVANVRMSVDGWFGGETAEDGTFAIAHAPTRWRELGARSGDRTGLRTRGQAAGYQLRLQRGSSVNGTMMDAKSGRPVIGAMVRIHPAAESFSIRAPRSSSISITDAKGNYSFKALPSGDWELRATHPAYSIASTRVRSKGAESVSSTMTGIARPVLIGVVADETRKPVPAAIITARRLGEESFFPQFRRAPLGFSGPDGRFVVRSDEVDQSFELLGQRKGLPNGTSGPLKLSAGERKNDVAILIPSGMSVTGRITNTKGEGLSGVEVSATENVQDRGSVIRTVMFSRSGSSSGEDAVKSDAKGTFLIKLKPGSYDLDFNLDGFAPKRLSSQVVGRETAPIEVVLEPGVEIQGRVVRADGSGVPDARLQLMSSGRQIEPVMTGGDGSFTIPNLLPGQLRLFVLKQEEMISEMRMVSAPSRDVLIELSPGGKISARVVDKGTKQPILDFDAGFTPGRGGPITIRRPSEKRPFRTDDGRFLLENVPAGQVDLKVSAPGYVETRMPAVKVEEGKVTEVEVVLEPGVRLVGKVTDAAGAPVAGVFVGQETADDGAMRGMLERSPLGTSVSTDANGDYVVDSLETSEKNFTFRKGGFVTEIRSVKLSGKETRLDVKLSKGKTVSGIVVNDSGAPVEGASVFASSALQNAGRSSARSDANGAFQLEGLAPGRYTFSANKAGFVSGQLRDVDVESVSGPMRIKLSNGGSIYGRVIGLSESELRNNVQIMVMGSAVARADASGAYRVPAVAPGNVRISAQINDMGSSRQTRLKSVVVEAGSQVEVDLEFDQSTAIRGRVTRDGKNVTSAQVNFSPRGGGTQARASGSTDAQGSYEIKGLQDGLYGVTVFDMSTRAVHQTSYTVNGSGTFDIDMKSTAIRGSVVDGQTGEPIVDASVMATRSSGEGFSGPGTVTDAAGAFNLDGLAEGSYRVRAQKSGYGQQNLDLVVTSTPSSELRFKLEKTPGVKLRIVDARDGRTLRGMISVRDARDFQAFEGAAVPDAAGLVSIPLAPGSYTATVNAMGYASQRVVITSPSAEIRIAMTPGGRLVIRSASTRTERAKLLDASGRPAFRELRLDPGVTTLETVAPGSYTLVALDEAGAEGKRVAVVVTEGVTTNVDF
ncbi:MAG TPA: carboxypeptidase regulatory-like domain-containing protein [Thermoanaerobaculia bacterium]|nr:carboxypeptidase regulatory-like domain-containing protein [Thermoanaerobaculia bacterium]